MKTLKSIFVAALTATVLSSTAFTASAAGRPSTVQHIAAALDIKKVIVTGTARVFIIQSTSEGVSINQEDAEKVTIGQVGNTLRISSDETNPVAVTVYVKSLFRVDVSNSACVKTVGELNLPYLQIMLKDNATARIKTTTESLYTVINGHADLELLGSTENHILKTDGFARLKTEKFAASATQREPLESGLVKTADSAGRGQAVLLKTIF